MQQWRACAIGALPCVFDPNGAVPPVTLPPAAGGDGTTVPLEAVETEEAVVAEASGSMPAGSAGSVLARAQSATEAVPEPCEGEQAAVPSASASELASGLSSAAVAVEPDAEGGSRPELAPGAVSLW